MDYFKSDKFKYFLFPSIVVTSIAAYFSMPNSEITHGLMLLTTITISTLFYVAYDQNIKLKSLNNSINDITNPAKVYAKYNELMSFAESLIKRPNNHGEPAFVFMGYNHKLKNHSYLRATIEALESGSIGNYYRIVTIRNRREVKDIIDFLKAIISSNIDNHKVFFYISYQSSSNYHSFLTVGEEDSIISVPDLTDSTKDIATHKCGTYIKDHAMVLGLRDVFQAIKLQDYTEKIELQPLINGDMDWETLEKNILTKYTKYKN